jgi:hypothetical protein
VIPTLQKLFGDMLATGAEALPLMSPEGLDAWKIYSLGCTVYEPQETTTVQKPMPIIDAEERERVRIKK